MGKGPQWLLLHRRETNGQQAHDKKLNLLPLWGNVSQTSVGYCFASTQIIIIKNTDGNRRWQWGETGAVILVQSGCL